MAYTDRDMIPHVRLQFNIEHPMLEDCWLEGYEASQHEVDEAANPFSVGTKEYQFWNDGWWAAAYGEEPLFQLEGGVNPAAIQTISASGKAKNASHADKTLGQLVFELGIALFVGLLAFEVADLVV